MRTLTLALLLFAQAQTYPPPYPRAGTTKLMENDRVVVWDVSWLKQAYPMHRHIYDYAGVYYTSGDRIIVSEQGNAIADELRCVGHLRPASRDYAQRGRRERSAASRCVRGVQGASTPRRRRRAHEPAGISRDLRQAAPRQRPRDDMGTRAGARSLAPHLHARDAVIVAFTKLKPRVTFVERGTVHNDEQIAGADRVFAFEVK